MRKRVSLISCVSKAQEETIFTPCVHKCRLHLSNLWVLYLECISRSAVIELRDVLLEVFQGLGCTLSNELHTQAARCLHIGHIHTTHLHVSRRCLFGVTGRMGVT